MKKHLVCIALCLVLAVGAFVGGMQYTKRSSGKERGEDRAARQQGFAERGGMRRAGEGRGDAFANGEVLTKDEKSITIKGRDGGSRIIYYSETTEVTKPTQGTVSDVAVGQRLVVAGEQNSDGSMTAKTIQLPLLAR